MSWVPERPGNWLFHCHMVVHMHPVNDAPDESRHDHDTTSAAGMSGLVLGIHVDGPPSAEPVPDSRRRKLRLVVEPDTRHRDARSFKVSLTGDGSPFPRVGQRAVPGPIMVLTRGEPVLVEIDNRLTSPTAIHWHGIELKSWDDGVPGFGRGPTGSVTPPVAPGQTFTARFTPPRAGTFIYHTHWHDPDQLAGGIYGPIVVLEPGEKLDPVTDHLVVIGLDGGYSVVGAEPFAINGEKVPVPLDLKAGTPHRLRFINITGDNVALVVQLTILQDPGRWTLVSKDGATIPLANRSERPARQRITVGETYDFEIAPMRAPSLPSVWIEIRRGSGEFLYQIPVQIR
jgi:FtsP/CotA-like multicopper oxidase with cupredoxin domain